MSTPSKRLTPSSDYAMSCEQIGAVLGLSKSRVEQIERDARAKLREIFDAKQLRFDDMAVHALVDLTEPATYEEGGRPRSRSEDAPAFAFRGITEIADESDGVE